MSADLDPETTLDAPCIYAGDASPLRLGLPAYSLGTTYAFDPLFDLSISRPYRSTGTTWL